MWQMMETNLIFVIVGAFGLLLGVSGLFFWFLSKRKRNRKIAESLATANRSTSNRSSEADSFLSRISASGANLEKGDRADRADEAAPESALTPTSAMARNVNPTELIQSESEKVRELLSQVKSRVELIFRTAQNAKANADELAVKESEIQAELDLATRTEKETRQKQEEIAQSLEALQEQIKVAQQTAANAQKELDLTLASEAKGVAILEVINAAKNEILQKLDRLKPIVAQRQVEAENAQRELKNGQGQFENAKQMEINAKLRTEEAERELKELQDAMAKTRAESKAAADQEQKIRHKVEELRPQLQDLKSELAAAELAKKRAESELYLFRVAAEKTNAELSLIRTKDAQQSQQNHDSEASIRGDRLIALTKETEEKKPPADGGLLLKDQIAKLLKEGYDLETIAQSLNLGKGQVEFLAKLQALDHSSEGEKRR